MTTYGRSSFLCVALVGFAALSCQPPSVSFDSGATARSLVAGTPPVSAPGVQEHDAAPVANADELEVLAYLWGRHTGLSRDEESALASTVVAEAIRHDMDVEMVLAVIHVESGGYHLAVSSVGALGLMQLLPSTAEELAHKLGIDWRGPDTLFDPVTNVTLGVAYLKQLENRFGSISTALAAYNWGPGRIDRRLRRGKVLPAEYIEQVMRAYDRAIQQRS
ncbi:MAG: lytic transglycosylase domain-containing protein [Deltaproteobacteria bacterium]|nr:lytic transglycosylase domain-containing protein [Deltaproteobacteria bacterium]MBW2417699.1 lytic transglycosylase domain-containing protein [Deltaproteobacteria bacterium]